MTDRPDPTGPPAKIHQAESTPPPAPATGDDDGPLPLRLAVLLLWTQAFLVGLLAVAEVGGLLLHGSDHLEWAAWVIAGPAVAAVALFVAGRLLVNRRGAGRGLAVALQLCAVPVVFFMVSGDSDGWVRAIGVLIGLSVLTCIALVATPSSRRALFG